MDRDGTMKTPLRNAIVRFAYPVFLAWPLLTASAAMHWKILPQSGLAARIGDVGLFLVTAVPVVLAIVMLERKLPWRPEQRVSREDMTTDALHLAGIWFVITPVAQAIVQGIAVVLAGQVAAVFGAHLWPSHWPVLAQLVLALLVADFGHYWYHRFSHETELGWRIHATHHGTPQVYWLNSTRFHAIEIVLQNLFQVGPLIVLGCSRQAFLLYGIFTAINGWVQHSNVDYKTGFLNWLLATPELHRWHHSTVIAEANGNYGVVLIVWDILFRTRFCPEGRRFVGPIGIGDMPDFPKSYLAQWASPFTWRRLPRLAPEGAGERAAEAPLANAS